jgi:hypothetical protein
MVHRLNDASLSEIRSHEEKLSFFANLYNVLYIHALVELGIPKPPGDANYGHARIKLSRRACYIVDGQRYTLMDIKYGILRGSMPLPNLSQRERQFLFPPKFSNADPRKKFCLDQAESRITFALCNLTNSSPRLRIFQPKNVNQELDIAVKEYIRDHLEMDSSNETSRPKLQVHLPKIFEWYRGDFGKTHANILLWIADHHWDWIVKSKLADFTYARAFQVIFKEFDWSTDISSASGIFNQTPVSTPS